MKNFDIPVHEFQQLRLSDRLNIFKKYLWWSARTKLIFSLGFFAPFFDFWYYSVILPDDVISTYCLLGCLVSCFFAIIAYVSFDWNRPYWVEICSDDLTKWLCAGIRYPID